MQKQEDITKKNVTNCVPTTIKNLTVKKSSSNYGLINMKML